MEEEGYDEFTPLVPPQSDPERRTPNVPAYLRLRSSKGFIIFVVSLGVFTDVFLYTLIIPILPSTLQRAGVAPDQTQGWVSLLLGAYGAAHLCTSPFAGYFSDRCESRRFPLLVGLLAMLVSTAMYCFGTNPWALFAARALQGASAAIIWVVGLALLVDTMGADNVGAAMGWQSIAMCAGLMLGPFLGGVLYDLAGHYAVWSLAFGILALELLFRGLMIERKVAQQWLPQKDSSYGTLNPPTPPPMYTDTTEYAVETTEASRLLAAMSLLAGPDSETDQSAAKTPIYFLLLSKPRLLVALWAVFACSIWLTSLGTVVPLHSMELFGWTPTAGGLLFMAFSFSCFADPYLGKLANRQGPRLLSIIGFVASTASFVALSTVTSDTHTTKALLGTVFVLFGFCCAFIQTPNMVEISVIVEAHAAQNPAHFGPGGGMAQAYALFNIANAAGSLIGPAWSGALRLSSGWSSMCYSFVALNALSVALILLFSGGWIGSRKFIRFRLHVDEDTMVQDVEDASEQV